MATKAAKSLTINATKFELANKLAIDPQTGKLQLIAKDVVLDEVDLPTPDVGDTLLMAEYLWDLGTPVKTFTLGYDDIFESGTVNIKPEITDLTIPTLNKFRHGAGADIAPTSMPNDICVAYIKNDFTAQAYGKGLRSMIESALEESPDKIIIEARYLTHGYSIWGIQYVDMMVETAVVYHFDLSTHTIDFQNIVESVIGTNDHTVVEATLTSDTSILQVGSQAGWRGISFTGKTFLEIVGLLRSNKVVYIALKGSTNVLTVYAPLTLTRTFADSWINTLTFVANGSVFTISDTPEIKRN